MIVIETNHNGKESTMTTKERERLHPQNVDSVHIAAETRRTLLKNTRNAVIAAKKAMLTRSAT
jgi:hypothetical protein